MRGEGQSGQPRCQDGLPQPTLIRLEGARGGGREWGWHRVGGFVCLCRKRVPGETVASI